jgi:SCY1-like protein 2
MFDKKLIKAPKTAAGLEVHDIIKRDASSIAKFKHPGILNLLEAPIEDNKTIAFITEPILANLSSLFTDKSRPDLIPSELEAKCMVLELMECVNFLHTGAKHVHLNLAPEHIYLTASGKLKIAGFNFIQPYSAEPVSLKLDYALKINEFAMVPNLRFAPPEVAQGNPVSVQADIFSVGCLIFFIVQLSRSKSPFLLQLHDTTNKQLHGNEC